MNANNILVLTVVVVQVSICYTVTRNPGKVGHIPGDVIIGGLVPIYQPDHDNSNCSNYVTGAYGILRVEAMRYTISKVTMLFLFYFREKIELILFSKIGFLLCMSGIAEISLCSLCSSGRVVLVYVLFMA